MYWDSLLSLGTCSCGHGGGSFDGDGENQISHHRHKGDVPAQKSTFPRMPDTKFYRICNTRESTRIEDLYKIQRKKDWVNENPE